MTDRDLKNFHVDTIAQYKVLRHISAEFLPEGIASLDLIGDGLRLTDRTGDTADFIFNAETASVNIKD